MKNKYRIIKSWTDTVDPLTKEVTSSEPRYIVQYKNFWTLGGWKNMMDLDEDVFYFNYFDDLVVAEIALTDYLRRRRSTKVDNCETVYTFEE